MTFYAVLGDMVASRALDPSERATAQERLRGLLRDVDRRWPDAVAAPFAITMGDQFQGLVRSAGAAWEVAQWLRAELVGSEWIMAIGRGPITTALAPSALEVDGPCFHRAREALDAAKGERIVLAVGGFGAVAEGFARYFAALYWSWTRRQREMATLLRVLAPAEVAARLGVDRSAISHLVRRLRWPLVEAGDQAFRHSLEGS